MLTVTSKEIKSPICAAEENSVKMSDGSHLIGDGVPFIAKMRDEGIVVPSTYH